MQSRLCLILFILYLLPSKVFGSPILKNSLSGNITDKSTGEPLPGVTIYIPDLKRGSISDVDGHYSIENLPPAKVNVQVTFIGYNRIVETIDLTITSTHDFAMLTSVSELNEIVVTGLSHSGEQNRNPAPVISVPKIELLQKTSNNLIDALTSRPGISEIGTGPGISKPVIRGLGFNRVVILYDGIRQEGQQWGDEHGLEIDENAVNSVEILKGPASLMYGSDAMAGVINLIAAPVLPLGSVQGNLTTNYQTNNGLISYSVNVAGNNKHFLWDLRYSDKSAHSYKNKYDGYVFNTSFSESAIDGSFGFNKSWGYSHINFSVYDIKPGIAEGDRDSLTGKFLKPVMLNDTTVSDKIATSKDLKSYDVFTPYQRVNHYRIVSDNNFVIGNGSLKAIVGWQLNERKEYADVLNFNQYGLFLKLNTINYSLNYILPQKKNTDISFGLNGMYQQSQNLGSEFLVPEYHLFDIGAFVMARKSYNDLDISGGIRYDTRSQVVDELFVDVDGIPVENDFVGAEQKFKGFTKTTDGISGSIGAAYQISEKYYSKLNFSRGYRAPNIAELGSNGEHEGSGRYEIGNVNLKAEGSYQWDFTFGVNSDHLTGELNLFTNTIDNFIFISKIVNQAGADSIIDGIPVFSYEATKANLSGGEISFDLHPHPLDWLHFENSFSYVRGVSLNEPDSSKNLPYIPAPKFTSELKATSKKLSKYMVNSYIKVGIDYNLKQDKIYIVNNTETPTADYMLFNFGFGTDISIDKKFPLSVYIGINNLFDVAYQNHLSRLKYAPENYATGRSGIYDMGRNLSVKLILNFESKPL